MSVFPLRYGPPKVGAAGRRLGIGVVGAGFIIRDCHLVAYRNAGFRVVGLYSRTRANAEATAKLRRVPCLYDSLDALLADPDVAVVDIGVPPHEQFGVIQRICERGRGKVRGVLAQKPLGVNYAQAKAAVELCERAGIVLAVNQNMRYDQSIRALQDLLGRGWLGAPVLATLEMRAIPHWMPWQAHQGWLTLRIMSIHHLDAFRFLFGDPERIFASVRTDPRTKFPHTDGICLYTLEYANGFRAAAWDDVWTGPAREGSSGDIHIQWRVEGTDGLALGTIGWPKYPRRSPSTLTFSCKKFGKRWLRPRWREVWFPDAFEGTMAQLLVALEKNLEPEISGRDHLKTMALVDAAYRSAEEHRAVRLTEIQ